MKMSFWLVALVFWLGIMAMGLLMSIYPSSYSSQYREGQLQCIKGEIHYSLVEQPDGTTIWVYSK